jgi:dihydrofolate synthase/folylpolyglutamate synthase
VTRPDDGSNPRAYLATLERFGVKLGLQTIRSIADELGSPEDHFRSVHIAGTNGKGSIAAMVEAALRAAGHRTARYTSPHLVRLEERFNIEGRPVEPAALDDAILRVRGAVSRLAARGDLSVEPTFFEVTTAVAFELFRQSNVTVAVLEVGLGGRFDATNIVTPAACCIASIGFDHEQYLGGTLEAIAFEKAGIVKRGVPVVVGPLPDRAEAVVRRICADVGAPLVDAQAGSLFRTSYEGGRSELVVRTPSRRYPPMMLALRGSHQVANAVVAVRLLETLDGLGISVPSEAVATGLTSVYWPARLDMRELPDGRRLLLDGAHNSDGARALATYVRTEWPEGCPLVFGVMADKRVAEMLDVLAPIARPLIVTQAPGPRAASADELATAAAAMGIADVEREPDIPDALARAWQSGPLIVVAGSLYLAGRVLEWLEKTGQH